MILAGKENIVCIAEKATVEEGLSIGENLRFELSNSEAPGVGLAAPQIGIKKAVFIITTGTETYTFCNPSIEKQAKPVEFEGEGCLSFPDESVTTIRYRDLFITDMFHPKGIWLHGFAAIVAQHEYQHLVGETMHDSTLQALHRAYICKCGSNIDFLSCCLPKIKKFKL